MILVCSQRAGAKALAQHLLKEENDHVEVHELRGFAADDLPGALNEAYALSRGTRCKQYLFSLSLNPPPGEQVSTALFKSAVDRAEERLGLSGQPRAIVFHEKEGRRHCHAVWSRIDAQEMKAVPLPFTHRKLQELARELYLENQWQMPRGLINSQESDPRNFSLAEWQQALRAGRDPREIKTAIQDCWAVSDSRQALQSALETRGLMLARGDRRAAVVVDHQGEAYALARWAGVKTRDVRERLGDMSSLPTVQEGADALAGTMRTRLGELRAQEDTAFTRRLALAKEARDTLVKDHREARRHLGEMQACRWEAETDERQARFRQGFRGAWDRLSGRHKRTAQRNELEALEALRRDRAEKDGLSFAQLEARRLQNTYLAQMREDHAALGKSLGGDIQRFEEKRQEARRAMLEDFRARSQRPARDEADSKPVDGDEQAERLQEIRTTRESGDDSGHRPEHAIQ